MRRSVAMKTPAVQMEPDSAVALRMREIASVLIPARDPGRLQPPWDDQRNFQEAPR